MNMAAFAVIVARERETGLGDSIDAVAGLGRERPWLAWPMTISMLGLAGIPATAGFIGKFYLIDAAVSGGYTWLGVVIVVGSMISLGYYLPVIAAMWMREAPAGAGARRRLRALPRASAPGAGRLPALAGGSPELDAEAERHGAGPAVTAGVPVQPIAPESPALSPRSCSSRCSPAPRRSSSASSRSRCSTWCTTPAARSAACSEPMTARRCRAPAFERPCCDIDRRSSTSAH